MEEDKIINQLKEKFGEKILDAKIQRARRVVITINRDDIYEVCKYLYENGYEYLSCISAVDYEDRFESVYHIFNAKTRVLVQIKAIIPKDDPKIKSVYSIWKAADWFEREAYDMMGIVYEGHPDLRRILLPHDFKGFPLRKDFKLTPAQWFEKKG